MTWPNEDCGWNGQRQLILNLSSAPASEPITTAEAKTHLRIDSSDDDTYIDTLIEAARRHVESFTNRALITQTWELYLDDFPNEILLPKPELVSVSSITYTDTAGASQTLSTDVYQVDTDHLPGRIFLKYGQTWPAVQEIPKAVKVTYVAGYGAASAVPQSIKTAIKILVAHWYENREPVIVGTNVASVPLSVEYLLMPYKVFNF